MYCKHCGKEIDEDSAFCSHCGKQISGIGNNINESDNQQTQVIDNSSSLSDQQIEENTEERKMYSKISGSTSKKYLLGCVVILLVFIVWGLYSLLGSKRIADITIDRVSEDLAIATQRYDRLYSFHEGLARVEKGKKYGFIDKLGKEIIPCKYDDADDFRNGLAVVKLGEKKGAINQDDKFAIPCIYEYLDIFKDNTVKARLNDKEGLLNYDGKTIVPFEYERCEGFCEGLALVEKDGLYGFVDKSGVIVIPCQYEDTYDWAGFSEGLAGVKLDGKWGYIDKTGKVIIPFDESLTGMPFSSGRSTIFRIDGDLNLTYTRTLSEMAIINTKGEQVSKWHRGDIRPFENGYASFSEESGYWWGLIDNNANMAVPCMFSVINYYSIKDGLVRVSQGSGQDGFYNINTNSLSIPCIYEDLAFEISEGLVSAKKDGKYGFVNTSNATVIPFVYDGASSFSEGFAVVSRYGKSGYVDRYGNDTFSMK